MDPAKVVQYANKLVLDINHDLGNFLKGHCVFIKCPLIPPLDDEFRVAVECIQDNDITNSDSDAKKHLIVLLETPGGFMETVERIVSVMRTHYDRVSFVIPNHAYSAGTVLVLSGDDIYMDYYSVLGPIDPQELAEEGDQFLPGVGYLAKYEELIEKINSSNSSTMAELTYLVKKFDPAKLFQIEQAINHGRSLISTWLPKYKFKDWALTETTKKEVNFKMKTDRAKEIATVLGDAKKWHSHGRGISMKDLTGEEIKLKIENFGKIKDLNELIKHYHSLCIDHFTVHSRYQGYIHSMHGARRVL